MSSIAIIGAGFSGLSSACFLAKAGFEVTVFEKNNSPGGRVRKFEARGFTFDMGPSWYWMPDVFETFFGHFDKRPEDYYELIRLDPSYRVIYSKTDKIDVPAGIQNISAMFEMLEPGSSKQLLQFLQEGKFKYEAGMHDLVFKPGLSLREFLDHRLLKGALKLHIFESMARYTRRFFSAPRLVQLLEFPVLFLGAKPEKTPALYSLMNYADMELGTWYPMGGMHRVISGMVSLAESLGVRFEFNSNVEKIEIDSTKVKGIVVNGVLRSFDYIVASADYHHVEQDLLPASHRRYSEDYWQKRVMAPSCLIFYLGINKKIDNLLHHNLFFDEEYKKHAEEIYDDPQWPSAPQFYVSCPSRTDASVAPPGCENIFILIPVATGLQDSEDIREKYFKVIMDRLEDLIGQNIRDHIVFKRNYAHQDFIHDYNAFKGNAYGLANTLSQTAILKPSIKNKKLKNLFYTGQLTVPGPGVPPAIISGQIAAKELIKTHREFVT